MTSPLSGGGGQVCRTAGRRRTAAQVRANLLWLSFYLAVSLSFIPVCVSVSVSVSVSVAVAVAVAVAVTVSISDLQLACILVRSLVDALANNIIVGPVCMQQTKVARRWAA